MITPGSHLLASAIDRFWISTLLRDANHVLCLDQREWEALAEVAGSTSNFDLLPNGVPEPVAVARRSEPGTAEVPEVLFLARLHQRKRPDLFAEAALSMLRRGVKAKFCIVGPPGGAESSVDEVINRARAEGFGPDSLVREPGLPPENVNLRMSRASVYVLPAEREPFGLTVTEALALGIPVVIRDDGGLASFVRRHRCGMCVSGDVASVADAVIHLLSNPELAADMGRRGAAAVNAELSIDAISERLETIYKASSK
jgi:glycosyltransferase involved in cell wall biosynthesis